MVALFKANATCSLLLESVVLVSYGAAPCHDILIQLPQDVVGLVNKVTYVLPPSGNARSQKRQVYITDGSEHAIVTLCGEHADLFDADGLMEASDEEPIIVLFVGMTISQCSGLLAFKNTSVTRWHVNVPILEIADVRERSKHLLWCIELHSANQSRSEPTVSLIEEMAAFEPNDIMGEFYKISNRITDVLITKGWYYISCKEYWKMVTLEDGVYKCPWCPTVIPLPRYRLIVGAVDAGSTDPLDAKFTDLYLFGPPEETVVRKEALLLVSSVQIVEPIVRANVVLREGVDYSAVGQDNVGIPAPETPKQVPGPAETSTPPLSMDLTPQTAGNIFSFRY